MFTVVLCVMVCGVDIRVTELLPFHGCLGNPTLHACPLSQCQPTAQARPRSPVHVSGLLAEMYVKQEHVDYTLSFSVDF